MSFERKYEVMIVLDEKFNENELKTWVFNYTRVLRKFSGCDVSVLSKGKQLLAYQMDNKNKGTYIQLNFLSMPRYITNFSKVLTTDDNVLRFSIFVK